MDTSADTKCMPIYQTHNEMNSIPGHEFQANMLTHVDMFNMPIVGLEQTSPNPGCNFVSSRNWSSRPESGKKC